MISELSEISGAFAGDGSLYKNGKSFTFEIRGAPDELQYYQDILKPKLEKIFGFSLKIIKRCYVGGYVIGLRTSKRIAYETFHEKLGFPVGEKSTIVEVPKMIIDDKRNWIPYLRGLFDTDGSIYLRHTGWFKFKSGERKRYSHPVVEFSTSSEKHKERINFMLRTLGFNCWMEKTKVRLGGKSTVDTFFRLIKPNNNKHKNRYKLCRDRLVGYGGGLLIHFPSGFQGSNPCPGAQLYLNLRTVFVNPWIL